MLQYFQLKIIAQLKSKLRSETVGSLLEWSCEWVNWARRTLTSTFVASKVTTIGDAGGDKDCNRTLPRFFIWELKHYFLLQLMYSGSPARLQFQQKIMTLSFKTSSTVSAAWNHIKSSRFARMCNLTWCLVYNRVEGRLTEESERGQAQRLGIK